MERRFRTYKRRIKMIHNSKIKFSVIFIAMFLPVLTGIVKADIPDKTVYLFYAENCTACKEAHSFYKKPAGLKDGASWTFNGIKFIQYRIVDENNKIISKNMNRLTGMCLSIAKKTGNSNFVYYRRDIYEFYKNKNLPYFRKEEKYSRKDEPFPTPVFITGNRVVLGFNQELVQKAIDSNK
jgi:hypothetical protein